MKIYTRSGDGGETALFGGGRVSKDHPRVEAYGQVDELNSVLGLAIVSLSGIPRSDLRQNLHQVQQDLFAIGAHLATPGAVEGDRASSHLPPLPSDRVAAMEAWIDEADTLLDPLRAFVLPGGTEAAAHLHVARAVCRRAERSVLSLSGASPVDRSIIIYLNRLSDVLFTYARLANHLLGEADVPWRGRD
jgi:cob(I)alamin adenosyltransferase